jgi:trehalose-6-phosphate synthase
MGAGEKRRRREAIAAHVRRHDIGRWITAQLADLDEARGRVAVSSSG